MGGLIMKDLYNYKQNGKQYLLMIVYFCVFAFMMKSPMYLIFMGVVAGIICIYSSLALDEAGGFAFVCMFPVSRKQIIGGKYLSCILQIMMHMVVSAVFSGGIAVWHKIGVVEWILMLMAAAGMLMIVASILIPVFIWLKTKKAGMVFIGICAILAVLLFCLTSKEGSAKLKVLLASTHEKALLLNGMAVFIAVSVLSLIVSFFISARIFQKREF